MQHDNGVSGSHVILMVPFPLVSVRFYKWFCLAGTLLEENILDRTIAAFILLVNTLFDNAIPAVKDITELSHSISEMKHPCAVFLTGERAFICYLCCFFG